MKTAQQIANEFKTELSALLRKYNAEISLTETYDNFYATVDGIQFTIPAVWDSNNNLVSDFATVNIGTWATSDNI